MSILSETSDSIVSPQKTKKKRSAKYYALSFFIKIAVTAIVVWILMTFIAGVYICHDNTSYPMIKDGDLCIVYRLGDIKQGDEIVYKQDGNIRFARVIAKESDSVEIFNDYITVNNYGISENAVYPTSPEGSVISYPYTVPDKCVFVLNDFRSDISDSRTFGGIPLNNIQGVVVLSMRMRGI